MPWPVFVGIVLIMVFATVGLVSMLRLVDRRLPNDLGQLAPYRPSERPVSSLTSRRVVVMNQGDDGKFRTSSVRGG